MKKFYEAPVAEELYANAPALMTDAGIGGSGNEEVVSGSDESGQDLSWGLLNK